MRRDADPPAHWRLISDDGEGRVFRNGTTAPPVRRSGTPPQKARLIDRTIEAERYTKALTPALCDELADDLGVPAGTLRDIGVGWCSTRTAWSFPERDAGGRVVGIVFRDQEGRKKAGLGHKRGVTIPRNLDDLPGPVLLPEGPSDLLACLASGRPAVGRPSNRGGVEIIAKLLRDRDVLVVGENDQKPDGAWPGRDGAVHVAEALAAAWDRPVRWTLPPGGHKDVRSLYIDDETGTDLLELLQANVQEVQPPDPSRLDESAARKLSRAIFAGQDSFRSAGLDLCRLLARFTDGDGFEAMGLMHQDRCGRTHRTLGWFAGPWGVTTRRVRQMIESGRLLLEMEEKNCIHLPAGQLSESHLTALLPLADEPEKLATACREAVQLADEEAQAKGRKRSRITARVIRKAVRGLLGVQAAPTKPRRSLWQLVAAAFDAAKLDPAAPPGVVEHLRAAHAETVRLASEGVTS